MLDLYLIRHAESQTNGLKDKVIHGQQKSVRLSSDGTNQAHYLGSRLFYEKVTFDGIYSSTAQRSRSTARLISLPINFPLRNITYSAKLLETNKGEWIGKNAKKVYDWLYHRNTEDPFYVKPPKGESYYDTAIRAEDFIMRNCIDGRIAVVTHKDVIKSLLKYIFNFNSQYLYDGISIENTSITQLKYDNHGWHIIRMNDYTHLH